MNRKLSAMNKLLMEENDRLQKQVSQLVYENSYFRQHTQNVGNSRSSTYYHLPSVGLLFWLENKRRVKKKQRKKLILMFQVLLVLAGKEMKFVT